jgi:ankyrin repeat protein
MSGIERTIPVRCGQVKKNNYPKGEIKMFKTKFKNLLVTLALITIFTAACAAPATQAIPTTIPSTVVPPTSEALLDAIKADDATEVQRILEAGVDPNLEVKSVHPMFVAVNMDNVEVVKLMVANGGDVTYETATGSSLLHAASTGKELLVAEFLLEQLLEQGWDINQQKQDTEGQTAFFDAVGIQNFPYAEMLLEAGADLDKPGNFQETTPLLFYARLGLVESVRFLVSHGANVDYQGEFGLTALHHAVMEDPNSNSVGGDIIATMQVLIDGGASLEIETDEGQTPLELAISLSHDKIAQFLRDAGAVQ